MIDNWICIEKDQEVLNAICEEEMEELESDTKSVAIDDADDDNEHESMQVDVDRFDTFSFVEALEVIQKLEQSACKLGVKKAATVHLANKPKQDTALHA